MFVIIFLILSLINCINGQYSTDSSESKITYILAESPTKTSNTSTKNETVATDSLATKNNPTSNDSVMTYLMEGPSTTGNGKKKSIKLQINWKNF
jgi:hypothetical protein